MEPKAKTTTDTSTNFCKNVIYSFKNRVSFIQEHKSNISDDTNLKSYVIACVEPYSAEHGSLELILAQFL